MVGRRIRCDTLSFSMNTHGTRDGYKPREQQGRPMDLDGRRKSEEHRRQCISNQRLLLELLGLAPCGPIQSRRILTLRLKSGEYVPSEQHAPQGMGVHIE